MELRGFSASGLFSLVVAFFVIGLLAPAISTAYIEQVAVIPPQPSRCDPIIFQVSGYFPDGCWHFDGYDIGVLPVLDPSSPIPLTVFRMRVLSHHDEGQGCPLVIVPYDISHELGMLRPGLYALQVVEVDSSDSSRIYDQKEISFSVRDSCGPIEDCVLSGFAPSEGICNAIVRQGSPGILTLTLRNAMPIAGAEVAVDGFLYLRDLPCGQGVFCDWRLVVTKVEPVMRAADMGVAWTFKDGRLHLMLEPISLENGGQGLGIIEPGEGPVARIWIELLGDTLTPLLPIPEYDLQVTLNPIAFAGEEGQVVLPCPTFAPLTGTICIRNGEKCDINSDGRADVVDIVNMIKCIMCTIPEGCCTPAQVAMSDCNGDGVLNVNDVVCCIRYILDSFCLWCETEQGGNQEGGSQASIGFSDNVSWESDTRFTVPVTLSSPVGARGVEARIDFDPQVLSVDQITVPDELKGAGLYYTASGGKLSLIMVGMGNGPLPMGSDGILARVSFEFVPGARAQTTEVLIEGAAGADNDGNRLALVRTNEKMAIEPKVTPTVHLASKPNPFLSATDVSLSIVSPQEGMLAIYDVAGRLVKTLYRGHFSEGAHTFNWDGKESSGLTVRSGVYFVRFEGKSNTITAKLVLLRSR